MRDDRLIFSAPETVDTVNILTGQNTRRAVGFHLGLQLTDHLARTIIRPLLDKAEREFYRHRLSGDSRPLWRPAAIDPRPIAAWYNVEPLGSIQYEDPLDERHFMPTYRHTIFIGRWPEVDIGAYDWRPPISCTIIRPVPGEVSREAVVRMAGIHDMAEGLGQYLFHCNGRLNLVGMSLIDTGAQLMVLDISSHRLGG